MVLMFVSHGTDMIMTTTASSKRELKPAARKPRSAAPASDMKAPVATFRVADAATSKYKVGTPLSVVATDLRDATPMQRVAAERQGVAARLVKELASEMAIPAARMFKIIGVPKATAERKAEKNQAISGGGGQSALGVLNLLGIAHCIVAESADEHASDFDVAKWLGRWIEHPQPALGIDVVARLLGSLQSGAYQ